MFQLLKNGVTVLKSGIFGNAHRQWFQLSSDEETLTCSSMRRRDDPSVSPNATGFPQLESYNLTTCLVDIKKIKEITYGQNTPNFVRNYNQIHHLERTSLSIVQMGDIPSLDIVCEDVEMFHTIASITKYLAIDKRG